MKNKKQNTAKRFRGMMKMSRKEVDALKRTMSKNKKLFSLIENKKQRKLEARMRKLFREGDKLNQKRKYTTKQVIALGHALRGRVEKRPTVVDLFQEVGIALRKQGVVTKEKALALVNIVKS